MRAAPQIRKLCFEVTSVNISKTVPKLEEPPASAVSNASISSSCLPFFSSASKYLWTRGSSKRFNLKLKPCKRFPSASVVQVTVLVSTTNIYIYIQISCLGTWHVEISIPWYRFQDYIDYIFLPINPLVEQVRSGEAQRLLIHAWSPLLQMMTSEAPRLRQITGTAKLLKEHN